VGTDDGLYAVFLNWDHAAIIDPSGQPYHQVPLMIIPV
jgi:hypothetical protein